MIVTFPGVYHRPRRSLYPSHTKTRPMKLIARIRQSIRGFLTGFIQRNAPLIKQTAIATMEELTFVIVGNLPLRRSIIATEPYKRTEAKVGRNEACPCGSGAKFKRCCA